MKRCPFCGEEEDLNYQYGTKDREGTPCNVICGSCGACGPWVYVQPGGESKADKEWNTRIESPGKSHD